MTMVVMIYGPIGMYQYHMITETPHGLIPEGSDCSPKLRMVEKWNLKDLYAFRFGDESDAQKKLIESEVI